MDCWGRGGGGHGMSESWSKQIAQAFQLELPADLTAWLDSEQWRRGGGAEFCRPQSPQELLEPEPGSIWGGFMLPDTLPLISNEYGDWLCLRVGFDGQITEVVYWCHGGGDWIPYGRTLAEALVYDAAFRVLYSRRFAEVSPPDREAEEVFRPAEWAYDWLDAGPAGKRAPLARFWRRSPAENQALLTELLASGVAEIAARRDLILRHLESQLKRRSAPAVAQQIGAIWEPDFVSWLFDTALIPELTREELSQHFRMPVDQLTVQDWDAAESEARKVAAVRPDLGWASDIAGWAAERRGDYDEAIARYLEGLRASAFSDDSVRFRTHWYGDGFGKFSAARLFALRDRLTPEQRADPYLQIFWQNEPLTLRRRLRDYWLAEGQRARGEQRDRDAYRCYYGAGWDCGVQSVEDYADILQRLEDAAQRSGSPALARVAALHRNEVRSGGEEGRD